MTEQKKAAKRKEYTVKVTTHTHMGVPCEKGDKISLTEAQADRLKKAGVI